jgi:hypothetical protein
VGTKWQSWEFKNWEAKPKKKNRAVSYFAAGVSLRTRLDISVK